MKYERFEDLPVWQAAADLAAKIMVWTDQPWFRGKGDLANQLQRASLSISNNIAEGFERGTTSELLHFLYIARGSAGEVRSMLGVMERTIRIQEQSSAGKDSTGAMATTSAHHSASQISNLKSQISDVSELKSAIAAFLSDCESISRQLRGWANSLQNSDIEGQRHLNDKTKQAYDNRQRSAAFQTRLAKLNDEATQKREAERREAERRMEQPRQIE